MVVCIFIDWEKRKPQVKSKKPTRIIAARIPIDLHDQMTKAAADTCSPTRSKLVERGCQLVLRERSRKKVLHRNEK